MTERPFTFKSVRFLSVSTALHCDCWLVLRVTCWPCDRLLKWCINRWPPCDRWLRSRVNRWPPCWLPCVFPATEFSAFWIRNLNAIRVWTRSLVYIIMYGSLPLGKLINGFLFAPFPPPPRCMVTSTPLFELGSLTHLFVHLFNDSTCQPWLNAGTLYFLISLFVWISFNRSTNGLKLFLSAGSGGDMCRCTSSRFTAMLFLK